MAAYSLDTLLSDCERRAQRYLRVPPGTLAAVWNALTKYLAEQLSDQKGVNIIGFAKFSFQEERVDSSGYQAIRKRLQPVLLLSDSFSRSNGAVYENPLPSKSIRIQDLNYFVLSVDLRMSKELALSCVRLLLQRIGEVIRSQTRTSLCISFGPLGDLFAERQVVQFRWKADFVNRFTVLHHQQIQQELRRPGSRSTSPGMLSNPTDNVGAVFKSQSARALLNAVSNSGNGNPSSALNSPHPDFSRSSGGGYNSSPNGPNGNLGASNGGFSGSANVSALQQSMFPSTRHNAESPTPLEILSTSVVGTPTASRPPSRPSNAPNPISYSPNAGSPRYPAAQDGSPGAAQAASPLGIISQSPLPSPNSITSDLLERRRRQLMEKQRANDQNRRTSADNSANHNANNTGNTVGNGLMSPLRSPGGGDSPHLARSPFQGSPRDADLIGQQRAQLSSAPSSLYTHNGMPMSNSTNAMNSSGRNNQYISNSGNLVHTSPLAILLANTSTARPMDRTVVPPLSFSPHQQQQQRGGHSDRSAHLDSDKNVNVSNGVSNNDHGHYGGGFDSNPNQKGQKQQAQQRSNSQPSSPRREYQHQQQPQLDFTYSGAPREHRSLSVSSNMSSTSSMQNSLFASAGGSPLRSSSNFRVPIAENLTATMQLAVERYESELQKERDRKYRDLQSFHQQVQRGREIQRMEAEQRRQDQSQMSEWLRAQMDEKNRRQQSAQASEERVFGPARPDFKLHPVERDVDTESERRRRDNLKLALESQIMARVQGRQMEVQSELAEDNAYLRRSAEDMQRERDAHRLRELYSKMEMKNAWESQIRMKEDKQAFASD